MDGALFITGGTGYIGGHLLKALASTRYSEIYCLCREPNGLSALVKPKGKFHPVYGDLLEGESYLTFLTKSQTVLHLAAATGGEAQESYFEVNTKGTKELIRACEEAGVENFLQISTIAVKYPDKSHYYYAQSKEQAEQIVRSSSLNYTILRPTIVLGEGSEIWKNLSLLTKLPLIPLFSNGEPKIQPIYINDLTELILEILEKEYFEGEILELGGPDEVTFEELLRTMREKRDGRSARILSLPGLAIQSLFAALESNSPIRFPLTAGQISPFLYDGTAMGNGFFQHQNREMTGLSRMIELVVGKEKEQAHTEQLTKECEVFTQYLIGERPDPYIVDKYHQAHHIDPRLQNMSIPAFDRFLLSIGGAHPWLTAIVDAHTSFFRQGAVIRKKLILLMALLESHGSSHRQFEISDSSSRIVLFTMLAWKGIMFGLRLGLAITLLLPLQMITAALSRAARRKGTT